MLVSEAAMALAESGKTRADVETLLRSNTITIREYNDYCKLWNKTYRLGLAMREFSELFRNYYSIQHKCPPH